MAKRTLSILIYSLTDGGAERVVSILLYNLQDKFNIILVLMNDSVFYNIPENIKIIYLKNLNFREIGITKLLKLPFLGYEYRNICLDNNVDVSLSFLNRPNYINIIAKIFKMKCKVVISERSMPSLQNKEGLQGIINKILIKKLYNKADVVTSNSIGNSVDLRDNFDIDNVITVNNPFDIESIIEQSKKGASLKGSGFKFITIGRLDTGKNHQLIIKAVKNIIEKYSNDYFDIKLYIIGGGALQQNIESQIRDLGLECRVFLLGRQINPYKYLTEADCFIFSSSHEGFPNVLVEALSCELPVISTDCQSGPREILAPDTDVNFQLKGGIEVSEYGILTTVKDCDSMQKAMLTIMSDSCLRDQYKEKSRGRSMDYCKHGSIQKFVDILK
jgi:N-acetylgalactosamine-N,N'-diacetylbacillosaminyl-diphospho-undecaprenol 4-alpha-N-acetylgalactosaminyltransferase